MKIQTSINFEFTGKLNKIKCPKTNKTLNVTSDGKIINLAKNWTHINEDFDTIFTALSVFGYSITPPLFVDEYRIDKNFIQSQLIMIDVDNGYTLDELLQDKLYLKHGAGYYTTASHSDQLHKFRIIFILENIIYDKLDFYFLYKGLINYYGSDVQCKDPARLFYGTENAKQSENRGKILAQVLIDELIKIEKAKDKKITEKHYETHEKYKNHVIDDAEKQEILELLKGTTIPDYGMWRNIGWSMYVSGFSLADFIYGTNEPNISSANSIWSNFKSGTSKIITTGTLMWWLFDNYGKDVVLTRLKIAKEQQELDKLALRMKQLRKK